VFEETGTKRTQEFLLRLSPDRQGSFRDIVRQQWNFSSPESIREVEEYRVELLDVTVLELIITPDIPLCIPSQVLCRQFHRIGGSC
jgi:hypothetical protein